MKKFILTFLACVAFAQIQAATSPLVESLLEYNAIINAIGNPNQTFMPQTEFIIKIDRLTKDVDVLGKVKYKIITQATFEDECSHIHHKKNTYVAELLVENNPGIGPNIITVIKIKQLHHKPKDHFENPS